MAGVESCASAREALGAPSLSRLTWDMPKILLRIAIVLVLGPFVSTANAKVIIHVDLDAQQMTVTKNNDETHVWKVSSGREGFEAPTGLFSVQRLDRRIRSIADALFNLF
jgi:hypothetical protein